MNKKTSHIIAIAAVALALVIVVVLAVVRRVNTAADPHAGHNHGTTHQTEATPVIRKPSESYSVTKNKDGTYSFEVKNPWGGALYTEDKLSEEPAFTELNDTTLCITGKNGADNLSTWAVYCDFAYMRTSRRFTRVLATAENRVAYVENRTDKWLVFVQDVYDETVYLEATELTDLKLNNDHQPDISYKKTKSGDLKVTYTATDGEKTVTVKMGK